MLVRYPDLSWPESHRGRAVAVGHHQPAVLEPNHAGRIAILLAIVCVGHFAQEVPGNAAIRRFVDVDPVIAAFDRVAPPAHGRNQVRR